MKHLLLTATITFAIVSCSQHNSKEGIVKRQKKIKAALDAAADSIMAT
jgi:hypothetical protein